MRPTTRNLLCAAAISFIAFGANAATSAEKQHKNDYNAAVTRADQEYKVASDACKAKQGNDKDVCIQQAKANRDKAKADAKAQLKSADAVASARDTKLEAQYKVAKERCDSLSGDAKDACIKQAKVQYGQ
jgi:DNA mismatch repair ATPase MutS